MTGVEVVRRPGRWSLVAPGLASTTATVLVAPGGAAPAALTALGTIVLLAGVVRGRHRFVDVGGLVVFGGVAFAGSGGVAAAPVVFATAMTVVAWDAGGNAVSLGRQLGARADTLRAELVHAVAGAVVGLTTGILGLVLFYAGPTRQPVTTLFVLLVAATLLVVSLNR